MKKIYHDTIVSSNLKLTSSSQYSTTSDEDLVELYQNTRSEKILNELLARHNSMCKGIAKIFAAKHPQIGSFEDFLQNTYVASLIGYNRFSIQISREKKNKLSTYLYTTIYRHLQTTIDEQGPIKCPSGLREVRSYFAGKYDDKPEIKSKFEQKYKITDDQSRHEVFSKYGLLRTESVGNFAHFANDNQDEGYIAQNIIDESMTVDNLTNSIAIRHIISHLTPIQQDILNLKWVQNESVASVAQFITEKTGKTFTSTMVYSEMNQIKEALSAFA